MNKKIALICFSSLLILLGFIPSPTTAYAEEDILTITQNDGYQTSEAYRPKASIVIDADTGAVLWADNPDLAWNPASIAKLMSVYLVLDAINQGSFTLDTTINATDSDQAISEIYELSNNSIIAGVAYPVRDLLYATLVESSNVATVMLANLVSNNDAAAFIQSMNEKANELGMTNSTFFNPSGAESSSFNGYYTPQGIDLSADNVTTARDLATLCYFLIKNYPDILSYTSPTQITIMENTPYAEVLENHNYSLPGLAYGYEGEDGLKTGSSPSGGYNYAATAKRGDMRLIEIVLGVGTWEDPEGELQRHAFGNAIFDLAFNNYEYKKLLSQGEQTINNEDVTLNQDFYGIVPKNSEPNYLLTNNTLTLDTDLTQVAPTIAAPRVSYEVKKEPVENKDLNQNLLPERKNSGLFFFSAILVISGLFFMILGKSIQEKHAHTRRRKKSNPCFALGSLLFIVGIGLLIYVAITTFLF